MNRYQVRVQGDFYGIWDRRIQDWYLSGLPSFQEAMRRQALLNV